MPQLHITIIEQVSYLFPKSNQEIYAVKTKSTITVNDTITIRPSFCDVHHIRLKRTTRCAMIKAYGVLQHPIRGDLDRHAAATLDSEIYVDKVQKRVELEQRVGILYSGHDVAIVTRTRDLSWPSYLFVARDGAKQIMFCCCKRWYLFLFVINLHFLWEVFIKS